MAVEHARPRMVASHEPKKVRRRWTCEKSLPPHLDPLPQGEEEPFGSVGAENERGRLISPNACAQRKDAFPERAGSDDLDESELLRIYGGGIRI